MSTQPRPVTDAEREMATTALRIVADIVRLDALADRERTARIGCPTAALRAAESLYVRVEQLARGTGDPALLDALARATRPPEN